MRKHIKYADSVRIWRTTTVVQIFHCDTMKPRRVHIINWAWRPSLKRGRHEYSPCGARRLQREEHWGVIFSSGRDEGSDGERLLGGTRRLRIAAFKLRNPCRKSEINLIRCNETLTLADFTRRRCRQKFHTSHLVWQEPTAFQKAITLLIFRLGISILSHFARSPEKRVNCIFFAVVEPFATSFPDNVTLHHGEMHYDNAKQVQSHCRPSWNNTLLRIFIFFFPCCSLGFHFPAWGSRLLNKEGCQIRSSEVLVLDLQDNFQ